MTFVDILRKEEEAEEPEAPPIGGDIHADVYELLDRYSRKEKGVTEEGLVKADEALQAFMEIVQGVSLPNVFREPIFSGKQLEGQAAVEQFQIDVEKYAKKVEDLYSTLTAMGEQEEQEDASEDYGEKIRGMKEFKEVMARLFNVEIKMKQRVELDQRAETVIEIIAEDLPDKKNYGVLEKLLSANRIAATKTTGLVSDLKKLLTTVGKTGGGDPSAQKHIKSLRQAGFFNRKNVSKIQDFLYNGKSIPKSFKALFVEPQAKWDEDEKDWSAYRYYSDQTSKSLMLEVFEREGLGRTDVSERKPIRQKMKGYFSLDVDSTVEKMEKIMFDGEGKDFHFLFTEDYADNVLFGVYRISAKLNQFYNRLKEEYSMEGYEEQRFTQKDRTQDTGEINRLLRVLEFLLTVNKLTGNSDKLKKKNLEVVTKLRKVGTRSFNRKRDKTVRSEEFDTFDINAIDVTEGTSKFPRLIAAWDNYKPEEQEPKKITIGGKKFPKGTDKQEIMDSLVDDIEKLKSRLSRSKNKKTIEAREKEIAAIYRTIDSLKPKVSEMNEIKEPTSQAQKDKLLRYLSRLLNTQMPNIKQTIKNNEEMLERLKRNNPDEYKYRKRETEEKIYALKHQLKLTTRLVNEMIHDT